MFSRLFYVSVLRSGVIATLWLYVVLGVRRFLRNTRHAGAWGKVLACIALSGWGVAVAIGAPVTQQWPPIQVYTDYVGRGNFALILLFGSFAPVAALTIRSVWLRLITTSYLLCIWLALLISSCIEWQFRPATMVCVAGVLGAVYSLVRIVSAWSEEGEF